MNLSALEQACIETRRLASLSECLQDILEDQQASVRHGSGNILDPDSGVVLDLISGIYGSGRSIVDLVGREISRVNDENPLPVLEEIPETKSEEKTTDVDEVPLPLLDEVLLAADEMLTSVTEVSHACELLSKTPFSQDFALPDFSQLAQQSTAVRYQLQNVHTSKAPIS